MRRFKEVLRLKRACGLSDREIAQGCGIAWSTVGDYLKRARVAGLAWPGANAGHSTDTPSHPNTPGRLIVMRR